jgi:hypothetical protein
MKYVSCLILLVASLSSYAQGDTSLLNRTPYDPKGDFHTWSLKGKVLAYPFGNGGGISYLLGVEYGFLKNQSIGIDGFVYHEWDVEDQATDTTGVGTQNGRDWSSWERALMLNYRYYFNFRKLRQKYGLALYTLAFARYGWINRRYDPGYIASYYTDTEKHRSVGLMLGGNLALSERLGIDLNMGMFEKVKDISTVDKYGATPVPQTVTGPGFRLSLNVTYAFYHQRRA